MAARPWSHSVFCDRERATEVRKAIASFFAAARETESTTGSLLCKPEAGAGIAIVELNRHLDISLAVRKRYSSSCFVTPAVLRANAAPPQRRSLRLRSMGQRPPALALALR